MPINDQMLQFFADYIQKNLGIVYPQSNFYQLAKRIEDIAKILGLASAEEFYTKAQQGIQGQMRQVLLDVATNNETSFFRDPQVYKMLFEQIFPELQNLATGKNVKIWCAASSFGLEPYSLSILSSEYLAKTPSAHEVEIRATDISDQALNRAKSGKYSQLEVQRGLSASRLIKNLTKDEQDYWTIKSEISKRVTFARQNLIEPFLDQGPFDLITCRYVLIYQADAMKKEIIAKLHRCLKPGGYLIMGGTESLIGLSSAFVQISGTGAIAYKKQ